MRIAQVKSGPWTYELYETEAGEVHLKATAEGPEGTENGSTYSAVKVEWARMKHGKRSIFGDTRPGAHGEIFTDGEPS